MNKPKTRILIIDDEEDLCFFLKANLEARGAYDVRTATSAVTGVKLVRRFKPDLVILDILMPGVDGFNVLRTIKEDNKTVHIPVLMLSALSDNESKV
jgi:DNA-binding response OmpR family regulator